MIITNFIMNFAKTDKYGTSLRCLMGTEFHGGFGKIYGADEGYKSYIENILPKRSPIKIPSLATIKEE